MMSNSNDLFDTNCEDINEGEFPPRALLDSNSSCDPNEPPVADEVVSPVATPMENDTDPHRLQQSPEVVDQSVVDDGDDQGLDQGSEHDDHDDVGGSKGETNGKFSAPDSSSSSPEEYCADDQDERTIFNDAPIQLPVGRVKKIMKADPDLELTSQDSVFLIAKATELFIESLAVEAYQVMVQNNKKILSRRDFDSCLRQVGALAFLDGTIDDEE